VVRADGPQLSLVSISALVNAISLKNRANLVKSLWAARIDAYDHGCGADKRPQPFHSGGSRDFPSLQYCWNNCRDALSSI